MLNTLETVSQPNRHQHMHLDSLNEVKSKARKTYGIWVDIIR